MYDKAYDQSDSADLESEGRVMSNVINMGGSGANVQSKTVKSTATQQTITPPAGVDGFNPVIVQAVEPGAKVLYAEGVTATSGTQLSVPNTEGITKVKAVIISAKNNATGTVMTLTEAYDDSGNTLMGSLLGYDSGYFAFVQEDTSTGFLGASVSTSAIVFTRKAGLSTTQLSTTYPYKVMVIGY